VNKSTQQTSLRHFTTRRGHVVVRPFFMPVYQHRESGSPLSFWERAPEVEACIVNSFFLYKNRDLRRQLLDAGTIHDFIGFHGLVSTDSGAFQAFTRKVLVSNKKIVKFQDQIRSDVIAPMDLITPPGDSRKVAEEKLNATIKRVREALPLVEHGILAGVQQGGRFLDLRRRAVEELMELDVEYLAIGSLVPFFAKRHDIELACRMIRDAREIAGPDMPMHIYGAGDPVEIPFWVKAGADIFDSASYYHFANGGYYMTPYGAVQDLGVVHAGEYRCNCPVCVQAESIDAVLASYDSLVMHNLWAILRTVQAIRTALIKDSLDTLIDEVLERHTAWFPDSSLKRSWEAFNE